MATIPYVTELSLTDESNILLSNPTPPPTTFTSPALEDSTLTNMITGDDYLMTSSQFPTSPLPCSFTLNSTTGGFGDTYPDSVYSYTGGIALSDDYTTTAYLLVTTTIDAGIAALPITTDAEIARKAYVVSLRAQIETYFDAANYTAANTYIQYTQLIIEALALGEQSTDSSLAVSSTTAFLATLVAYAPGQTTVLQGGWYNVLTNTLTEVEYPYTWNWSLPAGGTHSITNTSAYPDGVYQNYISEIWGGLLFSGDPDSKFANVYYGESYALVVTGITAGITAWQAAYDQLVNPTPTQTANNAILDGALAAIQAAFDAELYTEANALIAQVQAILAGGIGIAMYLNLSTTGTKAYKEANMLNYFLSGSLPSGVYTNQVSTLLNTITQDTYDFPSSYPANATDYTEVLNSVDLATQSKWTDAVYQSNVEFNIGDTAYQCVAYCLVLTSMNCVITKLTQSADACRSLQKQLGKLVSLRQMAIDSFNIGNYTGANNAIKKFNNVTDSCNCGCK